MKIKLILFTLLISFAFCAPAAFAGDTTPEKASKPEINKCTAKTVQVLGFLLSPDNAWACETKTLTDCKSYCKTFDDCNNCCSEWKDGVEVDSKCVWIKCPSS